MKQQLLLTSLKKGIYAILLIGASYLGAFATMQMSENEKSFHEGSHMVTETVELMA